MSFWRSERKESKSFRLPPHEWDFPNLARNSAEEKASFRGEDLTGPIRLPWFIMWRIAIECRLRRCRYDSHAGDAATLVAAIAIGRRGTDPNPVSTLGDRAVFGQDCPLALSARRRLYVVPRLGSSGNGARRGMALDHLPQEFSRFHDRKNQPEKEGEQQSWILVRFALAEAGLYDRGLRAGYGLLVRRPEVSGAPRSEGCGERGIAAHLREARHENHWDRRARIRLRPFALGNLGDHSRGLACAREESSKQRFGPINGLIGRRPESHAKPALSANLLPFNGDIRGRHFEPHHAVVCVQVNHNFQVRGTDAHRFVFPASGLLRTKGFHRNRSRNHVLGDDDGKRLLAAGLPVVDPRQHSELVIEIIVQHRDARRCEHEIFPQD